MKKLTFSAFIAFWSSIATLVALQAVATDPAASADATADGITLEQVAAHNIADDCWMAIEGKVYDLTKYLSMHPTPIAEHCGTEATEGMRTKGYGRDHSPAAWSMLEHYLIGELVE